MLPIPTARMVERTARWWHRVVLIGRDGIRERVGRRWEVHRNREPVHEPVSMFHVKQCREHRSGGWPREIEWWGSGALRRSDFQVEQSRVLPIPTARMVERTARWWHRVVLIGRDVAFERGQAGDGKSIGAANRLRTSTNRLRCFTWNSVVSIARVAGPGQLNGGDRGHSGEATFKWSTAECLRSPLPGWLRERHDGGVGWF
ncbi:hypothetical protein PSP31120_02513 [Pandoraea sputorum]|nr:hypothetical protein PSP31120_02513 [Pandoraea sputorum]